MRRRRANHSIQANLTPLIDVVFLLVVFFVLVSRIVDEDRPRLDLPSPSPLASLIPPPGEKVIVSVLPADVQGWRYHFADLDVPATDAGIDALSRALAHRLDRHHEAAVVVRAGSDTPWEFVSPVLAAARQGGSDVRVQLAVIRGDDS